MMYFVQICAVLYVFWASIYYDWGDGKPNGYAVSVVAFLAALLVTAIVIEIRLLPSRLARLRSSITRRLVGLKDELGREIASLPRSSWHGSDSLEDRSRLRIEKDIS